MGLRKGLLSLMSVVLLGGCSVMPNPYTRAELLARADADRDLVYTSQEPLDGTLELSEALARAVKYNLENRVRMMEAAVAEDRFELARLDMLPTLAASAGYFDRSEVNASSSESVITGRQSLEPSTSQEEEWGTADIRFTWNLLDFGVSYLQAKQQADRVLLARNARQRVLLNLLHQVRATYWRAAAMQHLSDEIQVVLARAEGTLADLRTVRDERLHAPVRTLRRTRAMVEVVRHLRSMQHEVNTARIELARLINAPPGSDFRVAVPEVTTLPAVPRNPEFLECIALVNSPDYRQNLYEARIGRLESRKELLRLLPGIEFSYGYNYDSNNFLVNNTWHQAAGQVAMNLMRLISLPAMREKAQAEDELATARRLATNMALITQVHLTWQDYRNSLARLEHSQELSQLDDQIATLTSRAQLTRAGSRVELVQEQMRSLHSAMGSLLAYADIQQAYGGLLTSAGLNPVPAAFQALPVAELASHIEGAVHRWESGEFPDPGLEEPDCQAPEVESERRSFHFRQPELLGPVTLSQRVFFDPGSHALADPAQRTLERLAERVAELRALGEIEIVGSTDPTGPAAFNRWLARRRAETVRRFLADRGVDPGAIRVRGVPGERGQPPAGAHEEPAEGRHAAITVRGLADARTAMASRPDPETEALEPAAVAAAPASTPSVAPSSAAPADAETSRATGEGR